MKRRVRFWAVIVVVCGTASLLAQVAFGGVTWQTPLRRVLSGASSSFVFSLCCSTLCIVTLPRLAPMVFRRFTPPFTWALLAGLLALLAAIGSFIGMLIFSMLGLVPVRSIVGVWMREPLKISVISTLLFGMFFTVVEQMRKRLDAARLALRTKERDEAEARRLAAEAQLASIESRVQPHFLFNTLNSIAALVHDDPGGRRAHDDAAGGVDAVVTRQHVQAARPAGRGAAGGRRLSGHRGCAFRQPASVQHRRAGSRADRRRCRACRCRRSSRTA